MKGAFWIALLALSFGAEAKEYKAVFDCSADNPRYIVGRMKLIEETIRLIERRGDSATFALTLHGSCVPMVSRHPEEIMDDDDLPLILEAQKTIERLHDHKKVDIVACAMSLRANGIDQEEVLPFVRISEDSFIDTIGFQNDGYALMAFP